MSSEYGLWLCQNLKQAAGPLSFLVGSGGSGPHLFFLVVCRDQAPGLFLGIKRPQLSHLWKPFTLEVVILLLF